MIKDLPTNKKTEETFWIKSWGFFDELTNSVNHPLLMEHLQAY